MTMKQILRIVLLLSVILLISSGLVKAQDPSKTFCGDLSKEDCALVTGSEAVMQSLDSHSFKLDAMMGLTGIPNMPTDKMNLHLTGSGALVTDHKALPDMSKFDPASLMKDQKAIFNLIAGAIPALSADLQFTLEIPAEIRKMPGNTKLPETVKLSLRLVDGNFYVNTADLAMFMPQGKSPADWMGINLPDMITAILKQPNLSTSMSSMTGGMSMGTNMAGMFSDPKSLGTFIKIERLADAEVNSRKVAVFKTTLDYPAMFAMPGMQDMLKQQMNAAGTKMSDKDIKVIMDQIQGMAKGLQFSSTQNIDLETKYVHQTDINMVFDFSSMKKQMGSAFVMSLNATVTQDDFNSVPAITAPKGAMVIPVESFLPSK
jgi:hypothetical protein